MIGTLLSFWDSIFSGAVFFLGGSVNHDVLDIILLRALVFEAFDSKKVTTHTSFFQRIKLGPFFGWAVLSDEQRSNGYPFLLLNDEQMSNKVGVEHQPVGHVSRISHKNRLPVSSR